MERKIRTARRTRWAVVLVAASLALTACGSSTPTESTADTTSQAADQATESTLRWGVTGTPSAVDIAHSFDTTSVAIQLLVVDTVIGMSGDGELVAGIAESWEQVDDLTYVFHLRDDATFWDGSPVTAQDVAYSLSRHLDPEVASQAAIYAAAVDTVQATDDSTVTVTLSTPDRQFLYAAALVWQVVKEDYAVEHPADLGTPEVLTMASGPYQVESYSSSDGLVLVRNDDYWGTPATFATVDVVVVPDTETLRLAISSGDIDGTFAVPVGELSAWQGTDGIDVQAVQANRTHYLSFDVTTAPLDDVHVRRAIAYATDREGITQAVTGGLGTVAKAPIPAPQVEAAAGGQDQVEEFLSALPTYDYDLDAARAELAQSAYPDGLELTMRYSSGDSTASRIVQVLTASLAEIGITLVAEGQTADVYGAQMWAHEDLSLLVMGATYLSREPAETLPDILSATAAEPNGYNMSQYTSATMEESLRQLRSASDDELGPIVQQILVESAEQAAYHPLFYPLQAVAVNDSLSYQDYGTFKSQWHHLVVPAAVG